MAKIAVALRGKVIGGQHMSVYQPLFCRVIHVVELGSDALLSILLLFVGRLGCLVGS